ncbi:MAG: glycosyltransferase family 2 protein [Candidatus Daviesbacteria bacterium]|nr:glycosyltransferase family 2 protein [Candidatus Daviesbacteria bacterium]
MKDSPLVSIIIVNWNGGVIMIDCLKSLEKLNYSNWELILIDNGSVDGSEDSVKNFKLNFKKNILIKNNSNLGFAKANNQGLLNTKGEYVLLLNNDTKVTPDFLNILIEKMESDKSIGVVQPKIFLMDKKDYLDNTGTYLTKIGFLEHWGFMQKDGNEFNKEREIFSAKGACLLFRKSIAEKVGLFDDKFFNYFEESDFCWRVWISGFKVMFIPDTYIYHKLGYSSKKQKQVVVNYHSMKNMLCAMIKNLEINNLVTIGGTHLFLIIGLSFYYLLKFRLGQFLMVWRAIFWNISNIEETLQKRKKIQQYRKATDKDIFEKVMHDISISQMIGHFNLVEANFK